MILLALTFAATTVPPATWTAPQQTSETVPVYFYLSQPDRSTREYWQGERLEMTTLQEWSRVLAAAIADGSTMLRLVETREEAEVVIEIRRCQILQDTHFVMGGFVETESASEAFLIDAIYSPLSLKESVRGVEATVERVTKVER